MVELLYSVYKEPVSTLHPTVLAIPESGIYEIPEIQEPVAETAEGDTEDEQNLHPGMIPDPNTSQRELTSDLITDPTVLAIPESGIYEIPDIQEPVAETAKGDTEDEQNLLPGMIPDPNTSQRELTSDLITDPAVLAIPESGIYEIPEIQEPVAETAEGDTEDEQNLHPGMIPDPNTSQRELTSDLITDPTVLAIPESGIYEIPDIQEPVAVSIVEEDVCISPDHGV
ncbi:uncharacterized protein [Dendrobates tinctorius]|uniref:uncharacterized protein n=1 Tax=Dendrobates tinctorius TaxID=92724 RepID=UPI003CC9F3AA